MQKDKPSETHQGQSTHGQGRAPRRSSFYVWFVAGPALLIAAFICFVLTTTRSDKETLALESSALMTKTRASRVAAEVNEVVSLAQAVILGYRSETKTLGELGNAHFEREPKLLAFEVFAQVPGGDGYEKTVELAKESIKASVAEKSALFQEVAARARREKVVLTASPFAAGSLVLAARFGEPKDPKHIIAVTVFNAGDLAQIFAGTDYDKTFLVHKDQQSAVSLFDVANADRTSTIESIWQAISPLKAPEGYSRLNVKGETWLSSFADVGISDLVVLSLVDKTAVLGSQGSLVRQSLTLYLALLSLLIFFAAFQSRRVQILLSKVQVAPLTTAPASQATTAPITPPVAQAIVEPVAPPVAQVVAPPVAQVVAPPVAQVVAPPVVQDAPTVAQVAPPVAPVIDQPISPIIRDAASEPPSEPVVTPIAKPTFKPILKPGSPEMTVESDGRTSTSDFALTQDFDGSLTTWVGTVTAAAGVSQALVKRTVLSVLEESSASLPETFSILNRVVCETYSNQAKVTIFGAQLQRATKTMAFMNAAHSPPLVYREANGLQQDVGLFKSALNNMSLGQDGDRAFTSPVGDVQLRSGDRLVFTTTVADDAAASRLAAELTTESQSHVESVRATLKATGGLIIVKIGKLQSPNRVENGAA